MSILENTKQKIEDLKQELRKQTKILDNLEFEEQLPKIKDKLFRRYFISKNSHVLDEGLKSWEVYHFVKEVKNMDHVEVISISRNDMFEDQFSVVIDNMYPINMLGLETSEEEFKKATDKYTEYYLETIKSCFN